MQLAHFVCGVSRPNELSICVELLFRPPKRWDTLALAQTRTRRTLKIACKMVGFTHWTCGRVPFISPIFLKRTLGFGPFKRYHRRSTVANQKGHGIALRSGGSADLTWDDEY